MALGRGVGARLAARQFPGRIGRNIGFDVVGPNPLRSANSAVICSGIRKLVRECPFRTGAKPIAVLG